MVISAIHHPYYIISKRTTVLRVVICTSRADDVIHHHLHPPPLRLRPRLLPFWRCPGCDVIVRKRKKAGTFYQVVLQKGQRSRSDGQRGVAGVGLWETGREKEIGKAAAPRRRQRDTTSMIASACNVNRRVAAGSRGSCRRRLDRRGQDRPAA